MNSKEIRQKYFDFFEKRGHTVIPSAALVPENDPTTLFTGSGMQPLLPYLLGEKHPKGNRLVDSQKSFRAEDIEEVGDNRHTTFFEMLGNWSLGDYFKKEQLHWFFEFLTDEVGLDPNNLYVTVYDGDSEIGVPRDEESVAVWKELFAKKNIEAEFISVGTEERGYEIGMQGGRIFGYTDKNWWSRAGKPQNMPAGEPGGPDSEVFYDFGLPHDEQFGKECHPNCDCGRFMEIGNSVFMQYVKKENGSFEELPQKNVDFGGGLERITAASNGNPDVFTTDLFHLVVEELGKGGADYEVEANKIAIRIIADHFRGAVFMIADGIIPSNTEQGYVLRRLLRRAIYQLQKLKAEIAIRHLVRVVQKPYEGVYPELEQKFEDIVKVIEEESAKFSKTLERGLKEFNWRAGKLENGKLVDQELPASIVFDLVTTYGFPFELVEEGARERGMTVNKMQFKNKMEAHRIKSRAGAEQKFKGGLADQGEKTVMLHTATHLMLAGLRKYLGDHVHQAGSNITAERTRFDFTHPEKVSREILDKVEAYVNEAIQKGCSVQIEVMSKEDAQKQGVEGSFWERYPDMVNVYKVVAEDGTVYSQELCGGPHVENTQKIEGTFKIIKEEAVSAGVRRVKAVLV